MARSKSDLKSTTSSKIKDILLSTATAEDASDDVIRDNIVRCVYQGRQAEVLEYIRTCASNGASTAFLKKLFHALGGTLSWIVEEEEYLPLEEDGEEENTTNPTTMTTASIAVSSSLLYMKACTNILHAYTDGILEKKQKSSEQSQQQKSTVIEVKVLDEALGMAELLHDVLFPLRSGYELDENHHNHEYDNNVTAFSSSSSSNNNTFTSELEDTSLLAHETHHSICTLCEKWWTNHLKGRDLLVTQLLPLLLVKTLDPSAKLNDVKRMYAVSDALRLLDFDDEESISYLKSLLCRTVSTPLYLRSATNKANNYGRKFIVGLFAMEQQQVIQDLHRAIKVQIPEAKLPVLQAYGEIYFKSWKYFASKNSKVDVNPIEEHVLQDFFYLSLNLESEKMVTSVRTVLKPFFDAKKSPDVDAMLFKMYGPILWRALKAVNPKVRANACAVLSDTFPLHDPRGTNIETEEVIIKTISMVKSLLVDDDHMVRIAAVEATARMLGTYWDALPSSDIRSLLNIVFTKLISDKSSADVRVTAVSSITLLLEAPCTHAVMRTLLPSLGLMINDKSDKVCLSIVKMLIRIKTLRGMKYYHVVPVDQLLSRLALEGQGTQNQKSSVASALTSLMQNSYFPQGEGITGSEQVRRTLTFLASHPDAADVFYKNLPTHLSVNSVSKLIAMLLKCFSVAIKNETDRKSEHSKKNIRKTAKNKKLSKKSQKSPEDDCNDSDNEEEDDSETIDNRSNLIASNIFLMCGIARTISSLWDSIVPSLNQNERCSDFLTDAFNDANVIDVFEYFDQKASSENVSTLSEKGENYAMICACLLRCASRMPTNVAINLSKTLLARLEKVGKNDSVEGLRIAPQIAFLCLCDKTDEIISSLASSISSKFGKTNIFSDDAFLAIGENDPSSKKRKQTKAVKSTFPIFPANTALVVLNVLLRGSEACFVEARDRIFTSNSSCSVLVGMFEESHRFVENVIGTNNDSTQVFQVKEIEFALTICDMYARFVIHHEACSGQQLQLGTMAKDILLWVTNRVLPTFEQNHITNDTMIGSLDISQISKIRTSDFPSSPKHRNSKRLSQSLDGGISFVCDEDVERSSSEAYNCAIYIIVSSLITFSEWLALGGSGNNDIEFHVNRWASVLDLMKARDESSQNIFRYVVSKFIHMAIELLNSGIFPSQLLRLIFMAVTDKNDGSDISKDICKLINIVLKSNAHSGPAEKNKLFANIVLDLVRRNMLDNECEDELPEKSSEMFEEDKNTILATSLSSMIETEEGKKVILSIISEKIENFIQKRETDEKAILFELKCLNILCFSTSWDRKNAFNESLKNDLNNFRTNMKNFRKSLEVSYDDAISMPMFENAIVSMRHVIKA